MCETNSCDELRQMLADCEKYLKEGETPAQRIERERSETDALLKMLIREKRETERMRKALEHFSSEWPELCQTERADCSGCAGFCGLPQSSGADPARRGEQPERFLARATAPAGCASNGSNEERTDK